MTRPDRVVLSLLLLAGLSALPGCPRHTSPDAASSASRPSSTQGAVPTSRTRSVPATSSFSPPLSFASLAKSADPGVVTILSRAERHAAFGPGRLVQGLGTGFVYDKTGLILTNNHVVEDATAVKVKYWDGTSTRAKIVGTDKHTDIAVLRVQVAKPLHALPLGDSDKIQVGDWVVAIGNPFGLSHTVSAGILSAKGRTRNDVRGLDPTGYFNFLQTDAAINQGNSGGPLLDLRGHVVGINTAIRANANSIGFAIPINMVRQLLPILVAHGRIDRSAMGIMVRELGGQDVEQRSGTKRGAIVVKVSPGSGADRAGIRPDDIIVEFDGHAIDNPDQLRWWASIAGIGKVVGVEVMRGKRTFSLRLKLGKLASDTTGGPH